MERDRHRGNGMIRMARQARGPVRCGSAISTKKPPAANAAGGEMGGQRPL